MTNEELKAMLEEFKAGLPKNLSIEEVNKAIDEKVKGLEGIEELKATVEAIKSGIVAIEGKLEQKGVEKKHKSIAEAIIEVFESKGIKSLADIKAHAGQEIEVKADNEMTTAAQTGTIMRTQQVSEVAFPRVRPYAFLRQPGIRTGVVGEGKSILLWTPAAYTSNVGYVGEYDVVANGNAATAQEKTRKMAKLGGFQIITSETFSDLPQFALRTQGKLMESLELKLDELILSGDGADGGANTEKIYGLKSSQMTAFDATVIDKVEKPNISDLVDGAATQAEISLYKTNTVWLHPKKVNKLRRTKDTTGQYVVNQLITGELVMGGHRVISNTGIGENEMIVGDISAIQLWFKQGFEMEFERIAGKDAWKMHVRTRAQVLVEDEDKKGLIYIDNVDTALAAINADEA